MKRAFIVLGTALLSALLLGCISPSKALVPAQTPMLSSAVAAPKPS